MCNERDQRYTLNTQLRVPYEQKWIDKSERIDEGRQMDIWRSREKEEHYYLIVAVDKNIL